MIVQKDALEFMYEMGDHSADMVFTSPPFKEEDVEGDYWKIYDLWMKEMLRVASKIVIVIHSATKDNYLTATYPPKRKMIWGKGISQYTYRWNPIFCYQISDEYKINKYIWNDCFGVQSVNGKYKMHKYQDPDLLYETIIKMFDGCQTVLDPFAGSGTTERVCKRLGKSFIGSDINPEQFKLNSAQLIMFPA